MTDPRLTKIEPFYTVQEVAEKLSVTPRTVYSYIKQGKLKALKPSRKLHIFESDLLQFLASEPLAYEKKEDGQKQASTSDNNQ